MNWVNFLHIYQPPYQKKDILREITEQSYLPLIALLEHLPQAKLTLNINACLTEQFLKYGYQSLIKRISSLVEKGQIELTESAKYHAFLPLLPVSEIKRQIRLNEQTNRRLFGSIYQPQGFFSPEMAYSDKVAKVVADFGYQWMVLNETAYDGKLFSKIDTSQIYQLQKYPTLKVLFRNRYLSDLMERGQVSEIDQFMSIVQDLINPREYLITAMDGEIFGHHHPGLEKLLPEIYQKTTSVTVKELIKFYPKVQDIQAVACSWSSLESEIDHNIPYAQWKFPKNKVHSLQWQLTNLAIRTINQAKNDPYYLKARRKLDQALISCQYWWAGTVPWWEIEPIEIGAYSLKEAIQSLKNVSAKIKNQAEELYNKIISTGFKWERTGFAHHKSINYTKKILTELGHSQNKISHLHSKR